METGTAWTYYFEPVRDRAGINFPGTLVKGLCEGYRRYRAEGRLGAYSPVQMHVPVIGRELTEAVVRFHERRREERLAVPAMPLFTESGERTYVAELVRQMGSEEREKILRSPLLNRLIRRHYIRDMSAATRDGIWELQQPLNLEANRPEIDELFNAFGIYFDLDFSSWSASAY